MASSDPATIDQKGDRQPETVPPSSDCRVGPHSNHAPRTLLKWYVFPWKDTCRRPQASNRKRSPQVPHMQLFNDHSIDIWTLSTRYQFSSVAQLCLTLCDPMNHSTPGLPVHHQLPEFTQTHAYRVGDAIQPSHPLSSPSPPAPNPSQHQGLFQWVNTLHEVAKVLEFLPVIRHPKSHPHPRRCYYLCVTAAKTKAQRH